MNSSTSREHKSRKWRDIPKPDPNKRYRKRRRWYSGVISLEADTNVEILHQEEINFDVELNEESKS